MFYEIRQGTLYDNRQRKPVCFIYYAKDPAAENGHQNYGRYYQENVPVINTCTFAMEECLNI
jgi:hypothetical protein